MNFFKKFLIYIYYGVGSAFISYFILVQKDQFYKLHNRVLRFFNKKSSLYIFVFLLALLILNFVWKMRRRILKFAIPLLIIIVAFLLVFLGIYVAFYFLTILILLLLIIYFYLNIKDYEENDGRFVNDEPLETLEDLKVCKKEAKEEKSFESREQYVKFLKKGIYNEDSKSEFQIENKSHVICIDGDFGTGKTSVINMIKNEILQEENLKEKEKIFNFLNLKRVKDIIWIDFNASSFDNITELTNDFFNVLDVEISCLYGEGISGKRRLIEFLTPVLEDYGWIKAIFNFFIHKGSLEELEKSLSERLKSIKEKIVIVVDDIDRMDTDQIFKVIKLVKFISELPKMIVILPLKYDRVGRVIRSRYCDKGDFTNYLQKIIQRRLPLEAFTYDELEAIFRNYMTHTSGKQVRNEIFEKYIMEVKRKNFASHKSKRNLRSDEYQHYDFVNSIFSKVYRVNFYPIFDLFKTFTNEVITNFLDKIDKSLYNSLDDIFSEISNIVIVLNSYNVLIQSWPFTQREKGLIMSEVNSICDKMGTAEKFKMQYIDAQPLENIKDTLVSTANSFMEGSEKLKKSLDGTITSIIRNHFENLPHRLARNKVFVEGEINRSGEFIDHKISFDNIRDEIKKTRSLTLDSSLVCPVNTGVIIKDWFVENLVTPRHVKQFANYISDLPKEELEDKDVRNERIEEYVSRGNY